MIEICPAILTSDKKEFLQQFQTYSKNFKTIDIDVNIKGDDFEGMETVNTEDLISVLNSNGELITGYDNFFNIHLMVTNPSVEINKFDLVKNIKFIVHQESRGVEQIIGPDVNVGVTVNPDSQLRGIDFYKQFSEVQLMTVVPGKQGNPFREDSIERSIWLREQGYEGKISIDGAVSIKTADVIKDYPIDRVSVGSYFSKSDDVETAKAKLELALNM